MPAQDDGPENEPRKDPETGNKDFPVQIDELDLSGLSALLTFSPHAPVIEFGERRTGRDRRMADRRVIFEEGQPE